MTDAASQAALDILHNYLVPRAKGSIFNTNKNLNTDYFASDIAPTHTPSIFRIYACLDTSAILTVRRTSGGNTVSEKMNSGAALTADCGYIFDIFVDSGETINVQASATANVLKVNVVEIGMGQ